MRSCRAKKAPDVTCSQSARAARGQVTSAAAQLWVQMRGGCRGGRGAGLAAAALRPLPSSRTPAPALKGAARRPDAAPGTPPSGSFPDPSALPCPGTPGLTAAHRLAEGRADRVLREGPSPASPAGVGTAPRPPQPLFVRGLRSRERVPRARPCGALSRSIRAHPLHDSRRRGPGSPPCLGGNRRLRGERVGLGHTSHEPWWGSPVECHAPSPTGDIQPLPLPAKSSPETALSGPPRQCALPTPKAVEGPPPADHCGNTTSPPPGRWESRVGTNTGNYTAGKCWAGNKQRPATHSSGWAS